MTSAHQLLDDSVIDGVPAAAFASDAITQAFSDTIIANEAALDASVFTSENQITAFRASAQIADVDATPSHQSKSFGQSVTILVPCGSTGVLTDADLSTTYDVELGAATNKAGASTARSRC